MRQKVHDGTHDKMCIQDFENYDVDTLKTMSGPFFWMIRRSGTALLSLCDITTETNYPQARRMFLFRAPEGPISAFAYYADSHDSSVEFYYFDGNALISIDFEKLTQIFHVHFDAFYNQLKIKYPAEVTHCNDPLDIEYINGAQERMKQCSVLASEINDNTLTSCVDRLKKWSRHSLDHHIEIYNDFADNSFGFCEKINGKVGIVGGIIFHTTNDKSYWSIHT